MKIGNKTVLISETIFLPDGDFAELEAVIRENDSLKLQIKTTNDAVNAAGEKPKPQIAWDLIDGVFHFNFSNFSEALGAATNSSTLFAASSRGEPIFYWALVYRLNTITKIELQVAMESQT